VTPKIVAGVGLGTRPSAPALNAARPQMGYPSARPAAPRAVAGASQYLGEPVAGAPVRTAPIGVGGGDCPGCGAGLKRDQDVHDGLNVKAVWPGAAIDVTNDQPMMQPRMAADDMRAQIAAQTSDGGSAPQASDASASADGGMEVVTPGVQSELGNPAAFTRGPARANGRARGTMKRAAAQAGLAGFGNLDSAGTSSPSHKQSLRSHLN
jgi:hypothetical protein